MTASLDGANGATSALPREAREGLMRAWLNLLASKHPNVTWVPISARDNTTGQRRR